MGPSLYNQHLILNKQTWFTHSKMYCHTCWMAFMFTYLKPAASYLKKQNKQELLFKAVVSVLMQRGHKPLVFSYSNIYEGSKFLSFWLHYVRQYHWQPFWTKRSKTLNMTKLSSFVASTQMTVNMTLLWWPYFIQSMINLNQINTKCDSSSVTCTKRRLLQISTYLVSWPQLCLLAKKEILADMCAH